MPPFILCVLCEISWTIVETDLSTEGRWKVWLTTNELPSSGTQAQVTLTAYGHRGCSKPVALGTPDGEIFQAGKVDQFTVCEPYLWTSFWIYRVAQKSKPLPNMQKIVLKPVNEIRFIRQIKVWISTIILFVGIRDSMRDLLSDLNNYAWPAKLAICVMYG